MIVPDDSGDFKERRSGSSVLGELNLRLSSRWAAYGVWYQSLNMPEFEQGWATRAAQIQTAATKMLDASQVAVA